MLRSLKGHYLHNDNYAKYTYFIHCMVDIVDKCKKVKRGPIRWSQVVWNLSELGFSGIQLKYYKFIQDHPYIKSKDRCAYNVLKKYFSIPLLRKARYEYKFLMYDYDIIVKMLLVNCTPSGKKSDWIVSI